MEDSENLFQLTGFVVRNWVSQAGKFATVDLDIPNNRGSAKLRVRSFESDGQIDTIRSLKPGQKVTVKGTVDSELLKDRNKNEILVDGFKKWIEVLTARSIAVAPSSQGSKKLNEGEEPKPSGSAGW